MRITADTNILVRALVGDDAAQAQRAVAALQRADLIAVPLVCLCELVWVLARVYDFDRPTIMAAIQTLIETRNVAVDRPAAEAGLAQLLAGGDFADGVIAYQGAWLGGEVFVSFDKKAVQLLHKQGRRAQLPD